MHLALKNNKSSFKPLNDDLGLLYAEAVEQPDGTFKEKGIMNPIIFQDQFSYGVLAKRVEMDSSNKHHMKVVYLYYTTRNFTEYELKAEINLQVEDVITLLDCVYDAVSKEYTIYWKNKYYSYLCVIEHLCELNATSLSASSKFPFTPLFMWDRPDIEQGNSIEIDDNLAEFLRKKLLPNQLNVTALTKLL